MKSKSMPYPKRGWLMTWLHLPFDLWRIRQGSPADARELLKYFETRRSIRLKGRPSELLLAALRKRAAEPDPLRGQVKRHRRPEEQGPSSTRPAS